MTDHITSRKERRYFRFCERTLIGAHPGLIFFFCKYAVNKSGQKKNRGVEVFVFFLATRWYLCALTQ